MVIRSMWYLFLSFSPRFYNEYIIWFNLAEIFYNMSHLQNPHKTITSAFFLYYDD